MSRLVFLGAIVLATACGPKGGGATDPCKDPCKGNGKMAAMTCDKMAENVAASMREHGELSDDELGTMQGMFASECSTQGWSQDAIDCMAASGNPDEAERCLESMTPEQADSLKAAFDTAEGEESTEDDGMDGAME